MGRGGGWEAGGGLYLPIKLFGVAMSPRATSHIGLDKPGGPKRHFTNIGVNIRHIPPSSALHGSHCLSCDFT